VVAVTATLHLKKVHQLKVKVLKVNIQIHTHSSCAFTAGGEHLLTITTSIT
jgi:hypothetical protein